MLNLINMSNKETNLMQIDDQSKINNYITMRNNDNLYTNLPGDNMGQKLIQSKENKKKVKPIYFYSVLIGLIIVSFIVGIVILLTKENDCPDNPEPSFELNSSNYIKIDGFFIYSGNNIRVIGANFLHKQDIFVVGNNKNFTIDNEGKIKNVGQDNFPLYFYFNENITNISNLFRDVKCFKTVDLSRMDSSKIIDVSSMFENSGFEEIYFGKKDTTKKFNKMEEETQNKYFDTSKILNAASLFKDCAKLKKIQLSPDFNVGKNAKEMFKGCIELEDVNIDFIISTEIEDMESMFENCKSLKDISFSNDFLTGEIKNLINCFKNTGLTTLDIGYFRLYNLESFNNIFDGSSIKGTLVIGKYYSDDDLRDELFKEIAKVTDPTTHVYTPNGTFIDQIFKDIYNIERNLDISVTPIYIDYKINYREDADYKLYSKKLHFALGWDFNKDNVYDLDSSIVTFNYNIEPLAYVYFNHLSEYDGAINLNNDDVTGEGDGDDEEIRVELDLLPYEVQIFTVQINSYKRNSLKDVKSAYIRISADGDVLGTYSINDAGDNIGLLIGCFYRIPTKSINDWYFKPLREVIPGHFVKESVNAIQEKLRPFFQKRSLPSDTIYNFIDDEELEDLIKKALNK